MIGIICYFFPAVVAIRLYEILTKDNLNLKQFVYRFCTNAIIINLVCIMAKKFASNTVNTPFMQPGGDFLPDTAFKYLLIAMATAVVVALVEALISRKLRIIIEEARNEEKEN